MPGMTLNTGVIEPLKPAATAQPAPSTASSVSHVVYAAQTPDIIKTAPIPQPLANITEISPAPPPTPQVILPDIMKMTRDLLESGQLLSDIPVATQARDTSALAGLQPGADPTPPPRDPILDAIKLAKSPVTPATMTDSGSWEQPSDLLKKVIIGLSVVTFLVVLLSAWRVVQTQPTASTLPVSSETPRVFQPDSVPAATLTK